MEQQSGSRSIDSSSYYSKSILSIQDLQQRTRSYDNLARPSHAQQQQRDISDAHSVVVARDRDYGYGAVNEKDLAEEADSLSVYSIDATKNADQAQEDEGFSYWKLFQFANGLDWLMIAVGTASAIAHGLSGPAVVLLFGLMNNAFALSPDAAFRGVVKVRSADLSQNVCWTQIGERQTAHIKTRYLDSLLKQDIAFYDTEAKVGDIVTAVSSDILLIHDAVGEKIGACVSNFAVFLGGIVISISVYWKMGLMGLTATPLLLGSGFMFVAFYTKYVIQALTAYRSADLVAEQAISQVRTVYSFVGETKALNSYAHLLEDAVKLSSKTGLSKGLGLGTVIAISYFSWTLQFWFGSKLVEKHEIKGGTVNSLIFISIISGKALGDCMQVFGFIAKGKAAASRLFRVIERQPRINNNSDQGKTLSRVRGRIELCNISFAYPARPEVPVFSNLSLNIPEGKIVALVGSSGSGKSTVISLIERFYDPLKGEVKLDGRDIKCLQLKWLRAQIGLVSQEPTLFATSIKKNILMGKPDASHEELISAAKVAGAHLFICDLPDAYNTEVGDKGIQLSGGQRQRIAIARAILKKPSVMLLDEATSALDSESEVLVQNALDRIMQGRTTIVVAHRLSTIRNADCILVFDKGRIIESGTHAELLGRENGAYKSLVMTQESAVVARKRRTRSRTPIAAPWASPLRSPWTSPSRISYESFNSQIEMPPVQENFQAAEEQGPGATKLQTSYSVKSWFKERFRRVWGSAIIGTSGALTSGILAAVFPLVMANVLVLLLQRRTKEAMKWTLGFIGLGIATLASNVVQYFFCHKVGARVTQDVQVKSLEGVLRNEVGWFDFEENSSSAVTARLSANATTLRNVLSDTYSYFLQNVLGIVLALTLATVYDYRMGLISLASLPLQVLGSAAAYFKDGFAGSNVQKTHENAGRVAGEAVSSIRTVLSFGAQDSILSKFQEHLDDAKSRRFKRACMVGLFIGVSHGLLYISSACCMLYGAYLIRRDEVSFGPLLISFSIVAYTAYHCVEVIGLIPDFKKGIQATISMFETANRLSEIDPDAAKATKLKKIAGTVEFRGVSFRYPSRPDVLILNNLSLKVPAGSTVALVGASGSGKSSVLALILRFYDPTSGSVMLDGRELKTLHLRSLRKHIGYVQQEPVLFGVSIRENILYGRDFGEDLDYSATESEMVAAAKKANAHEFISGLPDGYETNVGERGVQLSGGQKQRIAIARAMLKNPAVLLLDEATSALDAESERIVQQAIDRLVGEQQRTTVIVAHRLSTVQSANTIVVMENGSVRERGRHAKLLELGGAYAKLIAMQQRR
ncbi:hypothetical protein SELMODRAFT_86998 [Selaginella moellendorffii]|uniref:ATP-binding cassette transporter n=1 Tax=Selaginella moellendorffii TaxID=88036 RepID=D8R712_SELML|nr:hypothetical protein SELMODRAFT_86998 [Selaginella moellendorffii]